MEFTTKTGDLAKQKTPCLVLGVFEKRKLAAPAEAIDAASGGRLAELLKKGDLDGEAGRTLMLYDLPGVTAERVLLVGCGKKKAFSRANYRKAVAAAVAFLQTTHAGEAMRGHGGRHQVSPKRARQPAGQYLHPDLSGRAGIGFGRTARQTDLRYSGRKRYGSLGHGRVSVGIARQPPTRQADLP